MSFDPRDYQGDDEPVTCPTCDMSHPASYELSTCDQPGCETIGCHLCLHECRMSGHGGLFCDQHLSPVRLKGLKDPLSTCLRCEREALEEDERQAA